MRNIFYPTYYKIGDFALMPQGADFSILLTTKLNFLRSGRAGPSFLYGQKGSKEPIKGNPFDGFPLIIPS